MKVYQLPLSLSLSLSLLIIIPSHPAHGAPDVKPSTKDTNSQPRIDSNTFYDHDRDQDHDQDSQQMEGEHKRFTTDHQQPRHIHDNDADFQRPHHEEQMDGRPHRQDKSDSDENQQQWKDGRHPDGRREQSDTSDGEGHSVGDRVPQRRTNNDGDQDGMMDGRNLMRRQNNGSDDDRKRMGRDPNEQTKGHPYHQHNDTRDDEDGRGNRRDFIDQVKINDTDRPDFMRPDHKPGDRDENQPQWRKGQKNNTDDEPQSGTDHDMKRLPRRHERNETHGEDQERDRQVMEENVTDYQMGRRPPRHQSSNRTDEDQSEWMKGLAGRPGLRNQTNETDYQMRERPRLPRRHPSDGINVGDGDEDQWMRSSPRHLEANGTDDEDQKRTMMQHSDMRRSVDNQDNETGDSRGRGKNDTDDDYQWLRRPRHPHYIDADRSPRDSMGPTRNHTNGTDDGMRNRKPPRYPYNRTDDGDQYWRPRSVMGPHHNVTEVQNRTNQRIRDNHEHGHTKQNSSNVHHRIRKSMQASFAAVFNCLNETAENQKTCCRRSDNCGLKCPKNISSIASSDRMRCCEEANRGCPASYFQEQKEADKETKKRQHQIDEEGGKKKKPHSLRLKVVLKFTELFEDAFKHLCAIRWRILLASQHLRNNSNDLVVTGAGRLGADGLPSTRPEDHMYFPLVWNKQCIEDEQHLLRALFPEGQNTTNTTNNATRGANILQSESDNGVFVDWEVPSEVVPEVDQGLSSEPSSNDDYDVKLIGGLEDLTGTGDSTNNNNNESDDPEESKGWMIALLSVIGALCIGTGIAAVLIHRRRQQQESEKEIYEAILTDMYSQPVSEPSTV